MVTHLENINSFIAQLQYSSMFEFSELEAQVHHHLNPYLHASGP